MTRYRIQFTLLLTMALAIAGCGSSPKKPQPAALVPFSPSLSATVAWKADVGKSVRVGSGIGQFAPAVDGDSAYAASSSGTVSRVSLADGRLVWRTDVEAPLVAGVAGGRGVSRGMSAALTAKGELVLIGTDGKLLRRISLGGAAREAPVFADGVVVVRMADNRVAGWDVQTGERRWILQRTLPPLVLHGQSGMRVRALEPEESTADALDAADVLVNMPGGRLLWLNGTTGTLRWESQVAAPRGSNEVERLVDLLGSAAVDGRDVCVAAYQTQVSCLAGDTGRRLWSRDIVASTPVAADSRFVIVADDQSRLHALSRKDGSPAWSIDTFQMRGLTAPVSLGRAVWVADSLGVLHAVSREDGKLLARIPLDGGSVSGPLRPLRQGLLVQTQGGQLMLIRIDG